MTYIGTAGWSIRSEHADAFGAGTSHLQRYATRFHAVEINSSFYRPHRPATYARWAASVPDGFRFAVKMPRAITHEKRLQDVGDELKRFAGEVGALGETLGPVLIQLPPSLSFVPQTARGFFGDVRTVFPGRLALEPRHASWFGEEAEQVLRQFRIARVAADPALSPEAARPGGWDGFAYWRLHGSPRMYYSAYEPALLETLARKLAPEAWCIFDNTALGAATTDALQTARLVGGRANPA
jgi:uncharacterized protein YecE (DUF72 family)